MINGIPNPLGRDLGRIAKESKRFQTSDVDSLARIERESERFRESDVDVVTGKKKPRALRDWEKQNERG